MSSKLLRMTDPSFDVSFRDSYAFAAPPDELWRALGRTELYPSWWGWMREVEIEGSVPERGSRVSFRVFAPIPYRMGLVVEVVDSERPHWIQALVHGDLRGRAHLEFEPEGSDTLARVAWDVEIAGPKLRPVIRLARPLLVRAQYWAVRVALGGFRRYLEEGPA